MIYLKLTNSYKKITLIFINLLAIFFLLGAVIADDKIIINEIIIEKPNNQTNTFNPDSLKNYIKKINLKFPNIAYAQALLETANFTSNIFKHNYNLFGMKEAKQRPTTALGTRFGHAYYSDWKQSVIDYALWEAKYTSRFNSEKEVLNYMKTCYATDQEYINKIKKLMKNSQK